jgi:hypothetical protein
MLKKLSAAAVDYKFHASHLEQDGSSGELDFLAISISTALVASVRKRSLHRFTARHRFIDPRHQLRRQRAGVGSRYALSKLLSILNT